ncbi:peptidylprolyl isomerase [Sphingomonas sp. M1-B02]|uniref:peptidylprolyl isomerase n=1 Tax=Sphingomonas sp. M1-B02 TaxID=3114300 RepID=UPI00223EBE01|nr:peptidylprolyl isomerase [Sphingomonas sp. S6-11]UZK66430.1 peptidylprolyl isomerase [Sphingomonas sp. S6-11]
MMRGLLVLILGLLAVPAMAQTAPTPSPNPRVALETTAGRIIVEVEAAKAPITARNFLRYVAAKRLDGILFYRTVKVQDRFGFVQFGVQNAPARMYPPIKHEPTSETGVTHVDGAISMPRLAPGTARGEFTISVGAQPSFDASASDLGYAAFGRVVEGMDVVVKILDGAISPTKTLQGSFKGEVPAAPVKVLSARLVTP